ncbi:intradiol ring-cleavage dioxygenase [Streptomyces bobili]|uniref:intradiol ring-cleavage dioxygenase n=1 Tax=Streptomyces bobili TaxID=67280 RepID=UPI0033FF50D8
MTDTSHVPPEVPPNVAGRPVGRRTVLLGTGAAVATLAVGACTTTPEPDPDPSPAATATGDVCTLTKELTEGPYYLDGQFVRADITDGKAGIPLKLALTVVDAGTCEPLADALVELWHSDALGEYSGFVGRNGHDGPDNGTFLRGGVLTDSSGVAALTTVYPGWYRGRCIHIHVKVHTNVTPTSDGHFTGGQEIHTGQLFFDETVTDSVARVTPYSTNSVTRTTLAQDSIYDEGGATSGLLNLTGTTSTGYTGTLTLGVER